MCASNFVCAYFILERYTIKKSQILKRLVIKEELVNLTGSFKEVAILGQLLYWTERTKDYGLYLQQEIRFYKAV